MEGPVFSSINFKLIGLCIALLIVGYFFLGQGPVYNHLSWSVAPIILVGVYCILFPVAILYKGKGKAEEKKEKGV
jgi:hypothetical protein